MSQQKGNNPGCQTPELSKGRGRQKTKKKWKNSSQAYHESAGVIQAQSQSEEIQKEEFNNDIIKSSDVEESTNQEGLANSPLWKTKFCKFSQMGSCSRGSACHFAHSEAELRQVPDFSRTSICPRLRDAGKCDDLRCRYAHSREDLQEIAGLLKTRMCRFHARGACSLGSRCRFAHGDHELGIEGVTAATYQDENFASLVVPTDLPNKGLDHDNMEAFTPELNNVDGANETIEELSTSTYYWGMSPDNTPQTTPRAWYCPQGVGINKVGGAMEHSSQLTVEDDDSNPPTPDPVMAWRMQQVNAKALQSAEECFEHHELLESKLRSLSI